MFLGEEKGEIMEPDSEEPHIDKIVVGKREKN